MSLFVKNLFLIILFKLAEGKKKIQIYFLQLED